MARYPHLATDFYREFWLLMQKLCNEKSFPKRNQIFLSNPLFALSTQSRNILENCPVTNDFIHISFKYFVHKVDSNLEFPTHLKSCKVIFRGFRKIKEILPFSLDILHQSRINIVVCDVEKTPKLTGFRNFLDCGLTIIGSWLEQWRDVNNWNVCIFHFKLGKVG